MFGWLDHYATPTKTLGNPFAAISIRARAIDLVLAQERAELFNRLLGAEWWTYFAHCIEHAAHSFLMRNCQRETVARAAARVNERAIEIAPVIRPLANARVNAALNAFPSDEALDVGAKLSAIFCRRPNRVFLILAIDELLRQGWV